MVIPPNFPDEDTLQATQDQYYTELVPGREYQTLLPAKASTASDEALADLDTIDQSGYPGLTSADLSLL